MSTQVKIFSAKTLVASVNEIIDSGAVAVENSKIIALGSQKDLLQKYPQATHQDFEDQILLPGFVNAHCDLSLSQYLSPLEKFLSFDGSIHFMKWLVDLSRYKTQLSLEKQREAIQAGLNEILKTGVTTLGDVCRYPIALPLYLASGLRTVVLAEVENIQRPLAQDDFEQALALLDEVQSLEKPLLHAGIAPFSAYTLSKNLLRILARHAEQMEVPFHLHAALSFSEMEFFYDSLGEISSVLFKEAGWKDKIPPAHHMTPVQYLKEIGVLEINPTIIGALHLGPTDSQLLENHQCMRIFSPSAFRYLQLGDINWKQILEKKPRFALSSLGKAWGGQLNLWVEIKSILSDIEEGLRADLAKLLFHAVTMGGAHALNLSHEVGSLQTGKFADFMLLSSFENSSENFFSDLFQKNSSENIQKVFVSGKELKG
ncbi:MAG: amidohydrolase family protein [Deltaproteobacteria bacterium]|nr:amidohydrolase family protein [Deltaproteobacteria bacterium]